MLKQLSVVCLLVVAVAGRSGLVCSQEQPASTQPGYESVRKRAFDSNEALADWTITGNVIIDNTKTRQG